MVGLLVQLGVEGHDAAVGVLELGVQADEILLARAQLLERADELLVLPLDLLQRVLRPLPGQVGGDPREPRRGDDRRLSGKDLLQQDIRAVLGRLDGELVHQPPGADDPEPHPRRRTVLAVHDAREVGDAGTGVADADDEELGTRLALHPEVHLAAAGIGEGVARDLGHGRRDAGLLLHVEAEERGDLPGALAGRHHVVLVVDRHGQHGDAHRATPLATTTATSSCPRLKSR